MALTQVPSSMLANSGAELGMRNRIINGDMRIDQRNAGASVTPTVSAYTVDRWVAELTQSSKYSVQQVSSNLAGFQNAALFTSLSAYSVLSTDVFDFSQRIEGYNIADFAWGTASAQTVTLSFWVRSSLTGTFGGSIRNSGNTRSYPFSYSIPTANTWTFISVTILGDTSGTWLTTTGLGMSLSFGLGVGTTYSGTAGAWAAANYLSATGAQSVVGTNGATFYITGVQLEVGSNATPFERRLYGQELALCQRYYYKLSGFHLGYTYTASVPMNGTVPWKVDMRATPTISNIVFVPQSGNAGTGTWAALTNQMAFIYNSAANWSVGIGITVSAEISAEL